MKLNRAHAEGNETGTKKTGSNPGESNASNDVKYHLAFQHVGVASLPESYVERIELLPSRFEKLRLLVLEGHDLALSKLARNSPVNREDVAHLIKVVPLDRKILRTRYQKELRPNIIGDPEIHDRTLQMWIDAYFGS